MKRPVHYIKMYMHASNNTFESGINKDNGINKDKDNVIFVNKGFYSTTQF